MKKPIHISLLATLFFLFLAAGPALAQSPDNAETEDSTPPLAPSLTVGYLNIDFTYVGTDRITAYDFKGPLPALMLNWQHGSLALSYGQADSTGLRPSLRTLGTEFWLGGNVYIFRDLFRLPLAAFVPIRFNANYRYVSLNEGNAPAGAPERPTLHLVGSGLGAGGGARFAFPAGPSFIKDNLVVRASYVLAPGLMGNVGKGFDAAENSEQPLGELKLRWATDLNFEIQFKNLLNDSVGVTAGYTLRTVSRSPEKPDAFGDVLDAFIDRSDFVGVSDQHVLRVGINW